MKIRNKKKSIKAVLFPIIIAAILIPLIASSILSYTKSNKIIKERLIKSSDEITQEIDVNLEEFFIGLENTLDVIANNQNFIDLVKVEDGIIDGNLTSKEDIEYVTKEILDDITKSNDKFLSTYIGTKNKRMFADLGNAMSDNPSYDPTSRGWYKEAVKNNGEIVYTDPYIDANTKKLNFTICKALKDSNGQIMGVVGIDVDLEGFAKKYGNMKLGKTGYIFIISNDGKFVVNKDEKTIGKNLSEEDKNLFISETGSKIDEDNFMYSMKNERTGWTIGINFSKDEIKEEVDIIKNASILILLISVIVALILANIISNMITKPLKKLEDAITRASTGDFSQEININTNDEFGHIGTCFNDMIISLKNLLNEIKLSSEMVYKTSNDIEEMSNITENSTNQIAYAIEEIAGSNNQQAKDTEQGSQKANNLSNSITSISNEITDINAKFEETVCLNKSGIQIVKDLTDKTKQTIDNSRELDLAIKDMEESSKEISNIIEAINAIASQTNLLALNASIEAARAGEAGKGFAVVADEIRKLSEETTGASYKIGELIKKIQEKSNISVKSIENVSQTLQQQQESVVETRDIFDKISYDISNISNDISNVKNLNNDMINSKEDIVLSINNISELAQETCASTEEVSASTQQTLAIVENMVKSSDELKLLSDKLKDEVGKFKTE
ncbi:methyl-accepting chemotaxis protein [Tepidibacter hydrothermalis]|uniref:Methyl-accepting chemotaxis protein n=1 Tax=Tepidibacter hydrothermalis TaxID=3036126 RepID=A0ABY8EDA8_9FIRM|nr:methyl-accepting chemotaxis protein [Tepidibacter hydrothermalis]WFD09880.1 methyl-accepting chemotaxis protein [Tepidibacter hydrothermalis]